MTILEAMHDPHLFAPWFQGPSWDAWRVFLAALFGLPIEGEGAKLFQRHTGRSVPPTQPAREAWLVCGRRSGKSFISALVATYLATFRSYASVLAPGERATVMVLAADRRQARVVFRYVRAFLEIPLLRPLLVSETRESIELNNAVSIEIHTSNLKSVRGYSCAAVIADEVAYWPSDEAGASPDVETLNALRPAMATIPGAMLIAISSPYARRGALWDAYHRHFAQDGDSVLVWQADTRSMNPTIDQQVIADAFVADEAVASAEYGAIFRGDLESYISREVTEACTIAGRHELLPTSALRYVAFTDPSGGSQDSFTLAIAHRGPEGAVLDLLREIRPPFSPNAAVAELADVLKAYRLTTVVGDAYGGEWPRERFREHGITYRLSERPPTTPDAKPVRFPKSDIYRELLPLLHSQQVELLDHPRLINQLCNLERRTGHGGKDSIDHAPKAHDDLINAAAGALVLAKRTQRAPLSRANTRPALEFLPEFIRAW